MADGASRERWNHTANMICLWANINRDPKVRREPFEPAEFHPFADAEARRANHVNRFVIGQKDWGLVKAAWGFGNG